MTKQDGRNGIDQETAPTAAILAFFISLEEMVSENSKKDVRAAIYQRPHGYEVIATFIIWERRAWGGEVKPGDFRVQEKGGLRVKRFPASSLKKAVTILSGLAIFDIAKIEAVVQKLERKQRWHRPATNC